MQDKILGDINTNDVLSKDLVSADKIDSESKSEFTENGFSDIFQDFSQMDKTAKIGLLFSFYKNMLTKRQIDCVDLYYNEDLSLAEISDILGITRQGVRDNVKRAEHTMFSTEEKLGLVRKFLRISDRLEKIDDIIRDIEKSPNIRYLSDDIKHKINDILIIIGQINEDER